ncbi:F-box only protein 46 isoform X2 [Agelaius phoeniceus]|uniref:F-box only protein 46 isoform X2 n=1 Tax=Agelaius phoeniceus TaxID=39638 RepID=UPI004054A215
MRGAAPRKRPERRSGRARHGPLQLWCPRPFGTFSQNKPCSSPAATTAATPGAPRCPPGCRPSENTPPEPPEPGPAGTGTGTAAEDGRVLLDTWYVIKPGNTKEKVAFFVAHQCGGTASGTAGTAGRASTMKVKGNWGSDSSKAKRRRRCHHEPKTAPNPPWAAGDAPKGDGGGGGDGPDLLSVAEMVALVERRAALALQSLPRSPCDAPAPLVLLEAPGGPECRRVAAAVAQFESQKSQNHQHRERGGARPNGVCRAGAGGGGGQRRDRGARQCHHHHHGHGGGAGRGEDRLPHLERARGRGGRQRGAAEGPDHLRPVPAGEPGAAAAGRQGGQGRRGRRGGRGGGTGRWWHRGSGGGGAAGLRVRLPRGRGGDGRGGPVRVLRQGQRQAGDRGDRAAARGAAAAGTALPAARGNGGGRHHGHGWRRHRARTAAVAAAGTRRCAGLYRHVSHDFLEIRFKIQRLLEPRQYMLLLPEHVMVKIFSYLPTQALAALKCSCHYFKSIIETFGVRAADSRWNRDPLYRDDPCKQCKKRYERGDVSLCRWHPKPYHHDLPYGRSYWMCCRRTDREAPGCRTGLHDNNWVHPAGGRRDEGR